MGREPLEWHCVSNGRVCSGSWRRDRGEVEVDLETLKNASVVGLPTGWVIGGRWRYAEGSRNKIRRVGLARMSTGRLKGVELGMAVVVSRRCMNFGASLAALLLCVAEAVVWQSAPSQPSHGHWG